MAEDDANKPAGKLPAKAAAKPAAGKAVARLAPAPNPEGSLSRYLQEIRKFPMLEPQQEYMLARRCANTRRRGRAPAGDPHSGSSPRSPWAIAGWAPHRRGDFEGSSA